MKKELWKGNEAIAEAAVRAGCDGFFGYPITPQNEIPEYMSMRMPQVGKVFVQSESASCRSFIFPVPVIQIQFINLGYILR